MDIDIIGVGAAYEANGVNASILVTEADYRLLVDCGPSVPPALWRRSLPADAIDAIYITHTHPDHCLGLTTLINHWQHQKRKQPLTIVAQRPQWSRLQYLTLFGHQPDPEPGFHIEWLDADSLRHLGPWQMAAAPSRHSVSNRSLWLKSLHGSLFYSGDGRPTRRNREWLAAADVVFQECQSATPLPRLANHGDWPDTLEQTRKPGSLLCPYHIATGDRPTIKRLAAEQNNVVVPEDGDRLWLRDGQWQLRSAAN